MKKIMLFTQADQTKLQKQWRIAEQEEVPDKRMVIVKIFNPYGHHTWYVVEQDPDDPDTLYGFALDDQMPDGIEWGYLSKQELESIRIKLWNCRLPLERDRFFHPAPVSEVMAKIKDGNHV